MDGWVGLVESVYVCMLIGTVWMLQGEGRVKEGEEHTIESTKVMELYIVATATEPETELKA